MRLEDVSPRTWIFGAIAGWALAAWMLALAGMGGRVTPLPDDPSLLQSLPKPTRAPPERLGPFGQYAEISVRPLFSQDRRPQSFSLGGDDDTSNDFDYILSGVLLVPQVKLAMVQPSDGGDPLRVKLGDAVEAAPAWRLVALNPRSAVFEGPGGQKTLELRVFDGTGGEPPSGGDTIDDAQAGNAASPPPPPAAAVARAPGAGIASGPGAQKADATPAPPPDNTEQQMEALRKRIEQRRAQLRAQQAAAIRRVEPITRRVDAMKLRQPLAAAFAACLLALLAACASMPPPIVQRNGSPASAPATSATGAPATTTADGGIVNGAEPIPEQDAVPRAVIHRGSGRTINTEAANAPPPGFAASTGSASFNFEGESLQGVVKAILGDMLGQNFTIAPGVSGTVTLNVQKVSPASAFTLLEQVLSWNNARMVYTNGIYNIVTNDQALAGTVAPRTGPPTMSRGFEVRAVPLRYISATEMEKLLKPYARPNAIVSVDPGRNVITLAGTNTELENYLRTVQIFDVDWMSSMSVGVFPLQSGKATDVVSDLEKVFGEQGKSPVAGMFRFMPLEGANAVLVITPQPAYLDQIQQWLDRIDSAGGGVRLYSYELKYIRAKDLAQRLSEVFGNSGGQGGDNGGAPSLMPGTSPTQIRDSGVDDNSGMSTASTGGDSSGMGGDSSGTGGLGSGSLSLNQSGNGNGSVTLQVQGDKVGVSAVDETNSLLVRSTPQAWKSIREVIDRLDVMPMQVHIEAQIAQVQLNSDLKYGVDWYFKNALTGALSTAVSGIRSATSGAGQYTIFSGSAVAVLNALDSVTDVRVLSTPSVFVRNNSEAELNVGTNIPIQSVTIDPNTGGTNTYSQVQYLQTGKILKVRPRVTKDGVVFLDIVSEVSAPGATPASCATNSGACNPPVNVSRLKTEAAVQSGQTVMLAGLIDDSVDRGSSGIPGLSRIPVIGGLFGTQHSTKIRNETIILITPTIVRNPQEAADLTDEYSRRFRAMEPLQRPPSNRK